MTISKGFVASMFIFLAVLHFVGGEEKIAAQPAGPGADYRRGRTCAGVPVGRAAPGATVCRRAPPAATTSARATPT
ncbi:hypothetical protein BUALT_Bualt08G0083600 [Buddleja alternifolia]|uniref:Uncharacterized protein n=1 Tax=Buddleja alternifolia TaxID=168488 RepID=A0AAV6X6B2_9LAMI|nr:hypothetical protein BUALT_Bualt08G0083600 [Buddleja alternifolia]